MFSFEAKYKFVLNKKLLKVALRSLNPILNTVVFIFLFFLISGIKKSDTISVPYGQQHIPVIFCKKTQCNTGKLIGMIHLRL